jgi:hypothetical protein
LLIIDWLTIADSRLLIGGRPISAGSAFNQQSPITNQQRIANQRSDIQQ